MPTPILPHQVYEGGDYWASWGSKGWTAVRITSVRRKFAQVERINAKTNETKSRTAKVRLDELVRRDPKQKGTDKPEEGPDEVFASVRRLRKEAEERKAQSVAATARDADDDGEEGEGAPAAPVVQRPSEESMARVAKMLEAMDDKSTIYDWHGNGAKI